MAYSISSTDSLSASQRPSAGHTPAAVTELTGDKLTAKYSTSIAASGNTNANADTAFANVVSALETWITGTFLPGLKMDGAQSITVVNYIETFKLSADDILTSSAKEYDLTGYVEVQ